VLLSVLQLLEAKEGPILKDFNEEPPFLENTTSVLACPINIPRQDAQTNELGKLCLSFKTEIASLRPWYEIHLTKHKRTVVGASKLTLEEIGTFICSFLEGNEMNIPIGDIFFADKLKFSIDDLKAYYFEAMISQPGQEDITIKVFTDWFWRESQAGKALIKLKMMCLKNDNSMIQKVGKSFIVPSQVARTISQTDI
jgi:hypothetical protein